MIRCDFGVSVIVNRSNCDSVRNYIFYSVTIVWKYAESDTVSITDFHFSGRVYAPTRSGGSGDGVCLLREGDIDVLVTIDVDVSAGVVVTLFAHSICFTARENLGEDGIPLSVGALVLSVEGDIGPLYGSLVIAHAESYRACRWCEHCDANGFGDSLVFVFGSFYLDLRLTGGDSCNRSGTGDGGNRCIFRREFQRCIDGLHG
jgi:hypothetical protein